jgi:hypothetical protein
MTLSVSQNVRISEKSERMWKEEVAAYPHTCLALLWIMTKGLRLAGVPAKIRAEHLSDENEKLYCLSRLARLIW